ncbi:hypothetical protein LCGC14_2436900, partial [marine sediment metagenome]
MLGRGPIVALQALARLWGVAYLAVRVPSWEVSRHLSTPYYHQLMQPYTTNNN